MCGRLVVLVVRPYFGADVAPSPGAATITAIFTVVRCPVVLKAQPYSPPIGDDAQYFRDLRMHSVRVSTFNLSFSVLLALASN